MNKNQKKYKLFYGVLGIILTSLTLCAVFPILIEKNPALLAFVLASFMATAVLAILCGAYVGLKTDRYVKNNHFALWQRSKSHSFKERTHAQRQIRMLDAPYLEQISKKWHKVGWSLFLIWFAIVLVVMSYLFLIRR